MKAIIAVNNLWFIGLKDDLPWGRKCPDDLKHFKNLTSNSERIPNLLVGFNTFKNLPPLKGRNLILSPKSDSGVKISEEIDWCIGGKITYERWCHLFTELHVSVINDNTIGDTYFPNLENLNPDCKVFIYRFDKK